MTNPANQKIPNSFDPIICNRCDCVSELMLSTVFCPRSSSWLTASEGDGRVGRGCFEGSAKRIIRLAIEPPGPPAAYAGPMGRSHGLGTTVPGIKADVSSARYYPCCTLIGVHWHLELYLDHIYPWSLSVQLIRKKQT